jgi:hypothetical protein
VAYRGVISLWKTKADRAFSTCSPVQRIAKWGDGYMAPGGGEPESLLKMWRQIEHAWQEAGRKGKPR